MILYQLRCSSDHRFEAWFKDSATYESQAASGEVECPYCGDRSITKAPMAPNLAKGAKAKENSVPDIPDTPKDPVAKRAEEVSRQILEAFGKLRDTIEATSENVGSKFAEEARAIHYGETEQRSIYGETTDAEAEKLVEEGVPFQRLPWIGKRNS